MWPFNEKLSESKLSIKAIDNELERLHKVVSLQNFGVNSELYIKMMMLIDTLNEVARRHNGLEY